MHLKVVHEQSNWLVVVMTSQSLEVVDEVLPVNGSVVDNGQTHAILCRHGGHHRPVPLVDVWLVDT